MLINTLIINTKYRYRLKQAFNSIEGNTVAPNRSIKSSLIIISTCLLPF